jgi:hypothetical protein
MHANIVLNFQNDINIGISINKYHKNQGKVINMIVEEIAVPTRGSSE